MHFVRRGTGCDRSRDFPATYDAENLGEKFALVCEMAINGSRADLGPLRDGCDRAFAVAVFGNERNRGLDQPITFGIQVSLDLRGTSIRHTKK